MQGGMTVQITVRLPEDLVAFVDDEVRAGAATSRADVVARALHRERRRRRALSDVAILRRRPGSGGGAGGGGGGWGDVDDLDGIVRHQSERPVPLDD